MESDLCQNLQDGPSNSQNDEMFVKPNPLNLQHLPVMTPIKTLTPQSSSKSDNKENIEPNKVIPVAGKKVEKLPFYLYYSMVETDYFDNNLLMGTTKRNGCSCTKYFMSKEDTGFNNPFFVNPSSKRLAYRKVDFLKFGHINQTEALRMHCIDFSRNTMFHSIVTHSKPPIFASEYVKGTNDTIGCTYSLVVKLIKTSLIHTYSTQHLFEKSGCVHLKLNITNYPDFDKLFFCHQLEAPTLTCRKVYSVQVGRSCVRVLSEFIQPPDTYEDE